MVSSSDDVRNEIDPEIKKKLIRLVYQKRCFTLGEILKTSGEPEEIVKEFLTQLCYNGILKYVNGQYQHKNYSESNFI